MTEIYISCPWSFSKGLEEVVKYLATKISTNLSYNEKGTAYDFSLLESADHVVFVLDQFRWQESLENISRGMLTELVWCLNHRKPFYIAYRASSGLAIYGAEIDENLQLKGKAGTAGTLDIIVGQLKSEPVWGTIECNSIPFGDNSLYQLQDSNITVTGFIAPAKPTEYFY